MDNTIKETFKTYRHMLKKSINDDAAFSINTDILLEIIIFIIDYLYISREKKESVKLNDVENEDITIEDAANALKNFSNMRPNFDDFKDNKFYNQPNELQPENNDKISDYKLLTAAISILTTSSFSYKGKIINGCKKHPDEIINILESLSSEIFNNDSNIEKPISKNENDKFNFNFDLDSFKRDLTILINKHSIENSCDTPDIILTDFLFNCLQGFIYSINERDKWFNFEPWKDKLKNNK